MLGDASQGVRDVATTAASFQPVPWRRQRCSLAAGRFLHADAPDQPTDEAWLGAEVARRTGLTPGDRCSSGAALAAYPLTVAGLLRPTHGADDRTSLLSWASVGQRHEISREMTVKPLTAVLVRPTRLPDIPSVPRECTVGPETPAVIPSSVRLSLFNRLGRVESEPKLI